jgi:hypothetical protein
LDFATDEGAEGFQTRIALEVLSSHELTANQIATTDGADIGFLCEMAENVDYPFEKLRKGGFCLFQQVGAGCLPEVQIGMGGGPFGVSAPGRLVEFIGARDVEVGGRQGGGSDQIHQFVQAIRAAVIAPAGFFERVLRGGFLAEGNNASVANRRRYARRRRRSVRLTAALRP